MVKGFNKIPRLVRGFGPVMSRMLEREAQDVERKIERNWRNGRDATGEPWDALSPETVRRKGHDQILIETEEMIDSLDVNVDRSNMVAQIAVEDDKVLHHEFGTENMPARPILRPAGELLADEVEDATGKAFDSLLKGTGGGGAMVEVRRPG